MRFVIIAFLIISCQQQFEDFSRLETRLIYLVLWNMIFRRTERRLYTYFYCVQEKNLNIFHTCILMRLHVRTNFDSIVFYYLLVHGSTNL